MKGGIYSDEKCHVCGKTLRDNKRSAVCCPDHPDVRAARLRIKFGTVRLRFKSYEKANRFLTGFRYKTDEETFDEADYKKSNPFGFTNLFETWWKEKTGEGSERQIKKGTIKNYTLYQKAFYRYFGNQNIKLLATNQGFIDDFFKTLATQSGKTKNGYASCLSTFFSWVWRRNRIQLTKLGIPQPDIQKFPVKMKYRKRVSKDVQFEILEEVKWICSDARVYLGIKWLCTYVKIRPSEMLSLKEGDINLDTRYLVFPDPAQTKEGKWKEVPLIDEDVEILRTFPLSMKAMPFFRHTQAKQGVIVNKQYGSNHFYDYWKKACRNLGIEGVDLYGGTKHSSVTALGTKYSPEEIQERGTGHLSKSFLRYLDTSDEQSRKLYQDAVPKKASNVVEFKKVVGGTEKAPENAPFSGTKNDSSV
jgi:integrase